MTNNKPEHKQLAINVISVMSEHDAKAIDYKFLEDLQKLELQAYDILHDLPPNKDNYYA